MITHFTTLGLLCLQCNLDTTRDAIIWLWLSITKGSSDKIKHPALILMVNNCPLLRTSFLIAGCGNDNHPSSSRSFTFLFDLFSCCFMNVSMTFYWVVCRPLCSWAVWPMPCAVAMWCPSWSTHGGRGWALLLLDTPSVCLWNSMLACIIVYICSPPSTLFSYGAI